MTKRQSPAAHPLTRPRFFVDAGYSEPTWVYDYDTGQRFIIPALVPIADQAKKVKGLLGQLDAAGETVGVDDVYLGPSLLQLLREIDVQAVVVERPVFL